MSMHLVRGTPASPGAAIGPAWTRGTLEARPTGTPAEEIARVIDGLSRAGAELAGLVAALAADGHAADAEIVETNRMMATDRTLVDAAIREAQAGLPAAEAIARAVEPHARALDSLDDPMLAARAADLRSVGRRAADLSLGVADEPPAGAIVVADDLGPGEVASWAGRIAAIVLAGGGTTAHAAIVARSLHVPLVTAAGEQVLAIPVGEPVGIDADRGLVWRRPDDEVRDRLARPDRADPPAGGGRPGRAASARVDHRRPRPAPAGERRHGGRGDRGARGRRRRHRPACAASSRSSTRSAGRRSRTTCRRWSRCCARSQTASRRCGRSTSGPTRRRRSWPSRASAGCSAPAASAWRWPPTTASSRSCARSCASRATRCCASSCRW